MDIVERLRSYVGNHLYETHYSLESALIEAADEIERLREEVKANKDNDYHQGRSDGEEIGYRMGYDDGYRDGSEGGKW